MTTNETSFVLIESIIAEDVEAHVNLNQYIEKCCKFPKKTGDLSICAAAI